MKYMLILSLIACNKTGTVETAQVETPTEKTEKTETKKEEKSEQTEQKKSEEAEKKTTETSDIWIENAGLATPESVLYDRKNDRYLISNINGNPTAADGNGFISIVSPEGKLQNLKWIDGAGDEKGTTKLNAPKGMAILDDKLYVTDINAVRVFDLNSGKQWGSIDIKGSTFLNDAATDGEVVYVSDSGMNPDFSSSGTDAIYRIYKEGKHEKVVADKTFSKPNGLATRGMNIYMVNFGGAELRILNPKGESSEIHTLPKGSLDGIELRPDGSALISSWEANAVFLRKSDGSVETVVSNVDAPADIGWDIKRNRLLVPLFKQNKVLIKDLGPHNKK